MGVRLLLIYLATGLTFATVRHSWFVIQIARIVLDILIWPWHLWQRWRTKPDPNAPGGNVIIAAGSGKGTGRGGNAIIRLGTSERGLPGVLQIDGLRTVDCPTIVPDSYAYVHIDGRPCLLLIATKGVKDES